MRSPRRPRSVIRCWLTRLRPFARDHDKTRINLNVSTSISQLVTSQKVDLGLTLLQIQHPAQECPAFFDPEGLDHEFRKLTEIMLHRIAGRLQNCSAFCPSWWGLALLSQSAGD